MARKAERLLDRMRQSRSGWKPHHFQTLYIGFGFTHISATKHDVYIHPEFVDIRDTIPRHKKELSKAYASDAVKNIDLLLKLQKDRDENDE